ncbi:efflux RND transporter periplasmic adaptor subunit [uncultured Roseobacter sp.]|uniref:efflux RND transporter periplasmic adaptor subunit n=1 Tax=uncultured Roseobacter sp. TaxID=114847 RepID=UPI002611B477|nr:efflux RND transporter periplasmic adaptor subunit [uncultured Roseobacter sp.]
MQCKIFFLSLVAAGCLHVIDVSAQDSPVRPAKVTTVVATDSIIQRSYPAVVLPSREVELSFKVSGPVIELPVRAASQVLQGDVIARIDPRDFESQIAQLESRRDEAIAQLSALRSGARPEEVAALEAAVASAEAQVEQARDNLTRVEELVERGVSAEAQSETARADFRVAEANLRAQREQLRIGQVGGRAEDISAAEAALRGVEAQLQAARDDLADATLMAPFDGIIARRDIDNFTNVQAGQSIVLLQGLNVVHLAFDIPAPDVTALTLNGTDQISNTAFFDALPDQEFPTELVEFSVQADAATQTYRGRVAVEVPEDAVILPGMIARVISSTPGAAAEVRAPLSAIAAGPDGAPLVWLVGDDNMVAAQPVTLGEATGGEVAITEGLSSGDTIVAAGISQILDGMTIRPITRVGN